MKRTLVDSHGPEVTLIPLANVQVVDALKKLQGCSSGLTQASNWQPVHHTPGTRCQPESPIHLLFPERKHCGNWVSPYPQPSCGACSHDL
jgi:hypothetical protein